LYTAGARTYRYARVTDNYSGHDLEADRARRGQATRPQDKPVDGPSRGPCLAHRSPVDAYGLTRFACQQPMDRNRQTILKTATSPSLSSGS
jgi:hypothetical protein